MRYSLFSMALVALSGSAASAVPAVVQPVEADSKDTFVYQFRPTLPFGTATFLGAALEASGQHTTYTLVEFDTTGLSLDAGERAELGIYVRSNAGTPFSAVSTNPSPSAVVVVDVYRNTSAWTESVTFNTLPSIDPTPVASLSIDGIGRYFTTDVTPTVASWLSGTGTNFGFQLRQRALVTGDAAAVFESAGAANRPYLAIVPEPTILMTAPAVAGLLLRRARRAK